MVRAMSALVVGRATRRPARELAPVESLPADCGAAGKANDERRGERRLAQRIRVLERRARLAEPDVACDDDHRVGIAARRLQRREQASERRVVLAEGEGVERPRARAIGVVQAKRRRARAGTRLGARATRSSAARLGSMPPV